MHHLGNRDYTPQVRLTTWTTTLSATTGALAAIALTPTASQAAVVTVTSQPVSLTWPNGTQAFWDVDQDNVNDFRLWKNVTTDSSLVALNLSSSYNGAGIVGTGEVFQNPVNNLPIGAVIGPTLSAPYVWKNANTARTMVGNSGQIGGYGGIIGGFVNGFVEGSNNYFGFRFKDDQDPSKLYYGYANIQFGPLSNGARTVTILSWAYNDTAGAPITLGTGPSAAPGPIGLAGLAAGAAWSRRLRRRIRQAEAA